MAEENIGFVAYQNQGFERRDRFEGYDRQNVHTVFGFLCCFEALGILKNVQKPAAYGSVSVYGLSQGTYEGFMDIKKDGRLIDLLSQHLVEHSKGFVDAVAEREFPVLNAVVVDEDKLKQNIEMLRHSFPNYLFETYQRGKPIKREEESYILKKFPSLHSS